MNNAVRQLTRSGMDWNSQRFHIWDAIGVVYDNMVGYPDDMDGANPQAIGGGSIVIHNK